MKINIKKVILILLYCIAIALGSFASAISLLTNNAVLEYSLLTLTYILGVMLVRVRRKYPLLIKK